MPARNWGHTVIVVFSVGNVGGTSWKGQKTVFADEEHAPSSVEPVATGAHAYASRPGEGQSDTAESVLQQAQWKKIARRLLKQVRITIVRMLVVSFRILTCPVGDR